jgi:hypothetical protein
MVHDDRLAEGVAEQTQWQCLCRALRNTLTRAEPPHANVELLITDCLFVTLILLPLFVVLCQMLRMLLVDSITGPPACTISFHSFAIVFECLS